VLGDLLRGRRHEVFLASKVSPQRPWAQQIVNRGLSRRVVMQAVEGSLRRLQTDHLDLLYAHGPDPATPLEETLAAFDDLERAGKIRYAGLSKHSAAQVTEALWMAERHHLRPIAATQDLYNLLERENEQELYPVCRRHGVGTFAYAPLAGGLLSGK
jgi:aryl-alcohol dehydrogenase-like predicted oxidoreductase